VPFVHLALPQGKQESNVLNFALGAAGLLTIPAKERSKEENRKIVNANKEVDSI
jgi:hypothetical protein